MSVSFYENVDCFLQFSGIIKTLLWQIKLVVIHVQISGFFNSSLTECCFAACFRRGMVLNAGWIETSLETIAFLAESYIYPLRRPGKFSWKKRVLFLEKETPIANFIRPCCIERRWGNKIAQIPIWFRRKIQFQI